MRLSLVSSLAALLGFAVASAFAQGPAITHGGVVNAASFVQGQPISAGSLIAIFGSSLAPGTASAASVPLPTNLSNVTVTINGMNAPLDFVSTGQINAQIPFEVAGSATVSVVVNNNGAASPPEMVMLGASAPGVFQFNNHAIAVNVNDPSSPAYGTIVAASGSIQGLTTFPAHVGDILFLYATGLGTTSPVIPSGQGSGNVLAPTTANPVVLVGGATAQLLFSGLTPQFPGVYQVNFKVPTVNPGDAVPLQIQMGGITSPASTNIAIQ